MALIWNCVDPFSFRGYSHFMSLLCFNIRQGLFLVAVLLVLRIWYAIFFLIICLLPSGFEHQTRQFVYYKRASAVYLYSYPNNNLLLMVPWLLVHGYFCSICICNAILFWIILVFRPANNRLWCRVYPLRNHMSDRVYNLWYAK